MARGAKRMNVRRNERRQMARAASGGTLARIIVFLLVISAIGIGVKLLAGRKARMVPQGVEAQICAEEVVAAYLSSPAERQELFEQKGIQPRIVGEQVERSALAHARKGLDVRNPWAGLSFAPYESFRSKYLGNGRYRVKSHVIWPDAGTNKEWTLSYECLVTRIGGMDVWDVEDVRLEDVRTGDVWNMVFSGLDLELVDGAWVVRGGELVVTIADDSRPVRKVDLGSRSGG